jgi:hypothetical protein
MCCHHAIPFLLCTVLSCGQTLVSFEPYRERQRTIVPILTLHPMRSLASPPYTRVETGDLIVTQEHVYKFFAQFECVPLPTHWKSPRIAQRDDSHETRGSTGCFPHTSSLLLASWTWVQGSIWRIAETHVRRRFSQMCISLRNPWEKPPSADCLWKVLKR